MIEVQDVHIPFPGEKDNVWITPFWYEVMEFYPTFREKVEDRGDEPYQVQPYMLAVAKEIHKSGLRDDYSENQILQRCFQHFGLAWVTEYIDRYRNL